MSIMLGLPGLISIDHIGIAVFDLDAGIEWYQKFLGAKLISRETNADQMVEEASLDLRGTIFQLIKPINELSPINNFLKTRGEGLHQIAFEVSNLENSVDYAKENGIRVIFESSKIGTNGSRINFLHPKDCFGALIELVELPKDEFKIQKFQ